MAEEFFKLKQNRNDDVKRQNMTLFGLAIALLIPTLGVSITNVALPSISQSFGAPLSKVNWVVIAYLVSVTSLVLGAGALGDKFGRKRLLLTGIGAFSFASLLCAVSTTLWMLIGARFIQGLGAALILSSTLALIGTLLPKRKTGLAMGLMGTTAATGTALGPFVGGITLQLLSWPFIFWLLLPLAGLAYFLCVKLVPCDQVRMRNVKGLDLIGTGLLSTSCIFYALAMTSGNSIITLTNVIFLAAAISFFIFFIYSQKKLSSPLIDLSLLDNTLRNRTLIASLFVDAIAMSTLVIGPYYLTYALAMSPASVGVTMSIGPFIAAMSGYTSGKLVDSYGIKPILLIGLTLVALGSVCFAYLPLLFGIYGYIAALLVLTPGRQLFLASNHTFVIKSVSDKEKGLASGIINLCKNLGLLTGASFISGIFSFFLKPRSISDANVEQLNTAFSATFLVSSIFVVLSLASIALTSRHRKFSQ